MPGRRLVYPDGRAWHVVLNVTLRDELLYRTETCFAPEMPAPLRAAIGTGGRG